AGPGRDDRSERGVAGPDLLGDAAAHGAGAGEAGQHGKGRDRGGAQGAVRDPGQAGRHRGRNRRPGAVRRGAVREGSPDRLTGRTIMTTTSASPLDRPVQYLKGVGPKRAEIFARMGVDTARDLLYHVPRRYEDASTVTPIRSLEVGMDATVIGE